MLQDGVDRFFVTVDNVENAWRCTGLQHQFRQHQRHRGITLGWLQDESVTCREGGADFPQRDHGREVERSNAGDHTKWLAHRVNINARASALGIFAFKHMRRTEADFNHLDATLDVTLGVWQCLAMLAGECQRQLVVVTGNEFDEFLEDANTALRTGGGPGWLCSFGIFNSRR